jgi:hypothetical protein
LLIEQLEDNQLISIKICLWNILQALQDKNILNWGFNQLK